MKKYYLGLYEKAMPGELTWTEKLTAAKQAGFDFVEISIDETDQKLSRLDWSEAEFAALKEAISTVGMPIQTMCLSGHRKYPMGHEDQAVRCRSMAIMEKAISFAEKIGVRIIQLAGYDVYYEEGNDTTRRYFEENLKRAADMAARAGVLLGFETMETEFMNTTAKAMTYVNKVNSPYLGVYPDLGNITNAALTYGTDVLEDLESGRGHLLAMHLKETVPGKFREIPFGTGHVDFAAGISCAWDIGVRRYVTECWYTGDPDWRGDIAFANQMMADMLLRV